ncbi:MAG: hypothetical protein WD576_01885 [Nitriliruptoraceae bacterium]
MHDLERRLQDWVDATLISGEQAAAISAHERNRSNDPASVTAAAHTSDTAGDGAGVAGQPPQRSTMAAEAIGYVGAALAIGALLMLLSNMWVDLLVWARLVVLAAMTAALAGAGMTLRRAPSAAMQRLASVLLTAAVAGVAWLASVVAIDLVGMTGAAVSLTAGAAALISAIVVYAMVTRALLQVAIAVAALVTALSAISVPILSPSALWYGLLVGALGAAWLLLARGGWLHPVILADIIGAGLMLVGAQVASVDFAFDGQRAGAVSAGLVVAALLVLVAVRADALHFLILGALGLFVFVPQLVFELFGDVIGAPATLLLVGLLLVLLAVGLGRVRKDVTSRRHSTSEVNRGE